MNLYYNENKLQYAVQPSLPIWGDLEGWSVDPLQFKYPELTPFQYASNRCITGIDMDGAEFYVRKDGSITRGKDPNNIDVYIEKQKVVPVFNLQIPNDSPAKQVGLPTITYKEPITFEKKLIFEKQSISIEEFFF
jgi:hypothetical protein